MIPADEYGAFLATIKAAPDDDAPRLILADWLEENGEAERGEFIRVQVELARTPQTLPLGTMLECVDGKWKPWDGVSRVRGAVIGSATRETPNPQWHRLEARQQELFATLPEDGIRVDVRTVPVWRRGFVEELRCPWDAWRDHAKHILPLHPIREVTLTTEPKHFAFVNGHWWDSAHRWDGSRAAFHKSADLRWPGVTFKEAPQPAYGRNSSLGLPYLVVCEACRYANRCYFHGEPMGQWVVCPSCQVQTRTSERNTEREPVDRAWYSNVAEEMRRRIIQSMGIPPDLAGVR